MHIGFFIRALDVGGSERQLVGLAEGLAERGHRVFIYTFYPGSLDSEVKKSTLVLLNKKSRWDVFFIFRFIRLIKQHGIQVIYSFLPAQNLTATLVGILTGVK